MRSLSGTRCYGGTPQAHDDRWEIDPGPNPTPPIGQIEHQIRDLAAVLCGVSKDQISVCMSTGQRWKFVARFPDGFISCPNPSTSPVTAMTALHEHVMNVARRRAVLLETQATEIRNAIGEIRE